MQREDVALASRIVPFMTPAATEESPSVATDSFGLDTLSDESVRQLLEVTIRSSNQISFRLVLTLILSHVAVVPGLIQTHCKHPDVRDLSI